MDQPLQYFLFAGADYYPRRVMRDYIGGYDTLEQARAAIPAYSVVEHEWWTIAEVTERGLTLVEEGTIVDPERRPSTDIYRGDPLKRF